MSDTIVNKVAASALVTLDLEELYDSRERVSYDLADNLYEGIALREKDFREFLKTHDWTLYRNKNVAITCSADAIIPTWAYMLLISYLQPHAHHVIVGTVEELDRSLFNNAIDELDLETYRDRKVVIKGCSSREVPDSAYAELTRRLLPIASSIMFGEPCSTVPVYKRRRDKESG